ncbi:DUF169 domain-containing protein [Bacillaceae bacterium IKA-2]|nr:DUF169 domain-containing protein [Bacillaceae bacterium IKA-2]
MDTIINDKLTELDRAISQYVRTDTFPLAITIVKDETKIPKKAKRPLRDLGVRFSICQGISVARRYGWTLAMGAEDQSCPIARIAFGFEEEVSFYKEGNLPEGMYTKTCELGAKTESVVPKFSKEEAGTILMSSLSRTSFKPDIILVYGNSAQVMRMVAAALYNGGAEITSTFSARADCADIVIKTLQTKKPQVILPCYGDRVFGQTQDHEMAFTLPYESIDDFMEGLKGTHKGGVRYPIPVFSRYEAQFPPTYEALSRMFSE